MTIIALREMIGDYGHVREGDVFSIPDDMARRLVNRGVAKPWQPAHSPEPLREIQSFIRAPEEKRRLPEAPPPAVATRPFVSCIMPTADRARFVPGAIRNFLEQTYEPRELIIVDDGQRKATVSENQMIRHVRLDGHRSIGEKRNIAIRDHARGTVILHWDDDDRYSPDRIEHQVAMLDLAHAVVGYRDIEFLDERGGHFQMVGDVGYAAGTSLCYWRSWAVVHPFPETSVSEDNAFLKEATGRVLSFPSGGRVIARIHKGNTVKKRPGGHGWTRLPKKELPQWANI